MRKPTLYKLRGDYEFPWELTYRSLQGSWKEWKRFSLWQEAMDFMIRKKIPE